MRKKRAKGGEDTNIQLIPVPNPTNRAALHFSIFRAGARAPLVIVGVIVGFLLEQLS